MWGKRMISPDFLGKARGEASTLIFPLGGVATGRTERSREGWGTHTSWPHSKKQHSQHSAQGTLHFQTARRRSVPQTRTEATSPTRIHPPVPFCFLSHTGEVCLSESLALTPISTLACITWHLWTALGKPDSLLCPETRAPLEARCCVRSWGLLAVVSGEEL